MENPKKLNFFKGVEEEEIEKIEKNVNLALYKDLTSFSKIFQQFPYIYELFTYYERFFFWI